MLLRSRDYRLLPLSPHNLKRQIGISSFQIPLLIVQTENLPGNAGYFAEQLVMDSVQKVSGLRGYCGEFHSKKCLRGTKKTPPKCLIFKNLA
jgi:hypothetical protein